MPELREDIKSALQSLISQPLRQASLALLATLGYRSDRTLVLEGSRPQAFLDLIESQGGATKFDSEKACFADWKSAEILFQLTDEDLAASSSLFKETDIKSGLLRSYLFFAIELKGSDHSRSKLSAIARQINRVFPMPVMVLLKHDRCLSIAVINRRQNKIHADKDVLEKVTLIRDISLIAPHRGHLEILQSIAFAELEHPKKLPIRDFDTLHAAWEQIFNIELLNNRFYKELSNWYFWALDQVDFPDDLEKDAEKRRATGLIRMLTRLIFCWFLKEKDGLIPGNLFDKEELEKILHGFDPESETSSTYYQAILQNLFFATLNQRMGKDSKGNPYRYFATDEGFQKNRATYDINNLYRYENLFAVSQEEAIALFADIPFLNGGLFECLDRTEDGTNKKLYLDGFSRRKEKRPHVPDRLFFDSGETADLSAAYGDKKRKKEQVTGLISILNRYKFTIVENTPIDQEIALDPELLGKVFENLLASYNEETKTTARKQTGSFYTPRPIVDYMVDESLKAHLSRALVEKAGMKEEDARAGLDILFAYTEKEHAFEAPEVATLITAIDEVKILDPACGSGAFPMGVLHKLVYILGKLDEKNEKWEQIRIDEAQKISDADERRRRISEIMSNFADNNDDYGRKLYLIENCLYGVDIQPIAIQITKLRFFISLVCDQKTNRNKKENHGIRPLPNLETKFVAADTLIGLPEMTQSLLVDPRVGIIEKEIESLYHSHFSEQNRTKKLANQRKVKSLRQELGKLLTESLMSPVKSKHVAEWDPFDPQSRADFFDPHWMFGAALAKGFDLVIGNPPYVRIQMLSQADPKQPARLKEQYTSASKGNYDLYVVFVERGLQLLQPHGQLSYILPHKFFNAQYGEPLRKLLADGKNLRQVVHFGDEQIFPGATNYVCLLFLDKAGAEHCRWVRAHDMPAWQDSLSAPETMIAADRITSADWNFAVGKDANLFEKLKALPVTLGTVANIFVGLQTSADAVFIMNLVSETAQTVTLKSKVLARNWAFERELLHPVVSGTDISPYMPLPRRQFILFPYVVEHSQAALIPIKQLANSWPQTAEYLVENRTLLEQRESGKFGDESWHRFGRSQNLGIQQQPKLCVPRLVEYLHAAPDFDGTHCLDNVDVGGVTFKESAKQHSLSYLLALLNCRLLRWFFPYVSAPFRGGFRSANKQFLSLVPFRTINFAVAAERAQHDAIASLVKRILAAKQANPAADTSTLEHEIDQQVYALYGLTPEEIAIVEGTAP